MTCLFFCCSMFGALSHIYVRKNAVVLTLGFERKIAFMSSYIWVISLVFWSSSCSHSSANDGRTKALVLYLHIQCCSFGVYYKNLIVSCMKKLWMFSLERGPGTIYWDRIYDLHDIRCLGFCHIKKAYLSTLFSIFLNCVLK